MAVALCWEVEGVSSLDPGKSVAPGLIRAARVTRVPFHFGSLPEAVGSVGGTGWPWEGDGPRAPARAPCSLGRCWSWRREGDPGARSWPALRLCPDPWPGRGRLSLLVPACGVVLRAGAGPLRRLLGILSARIFLSTAGEGVRFRAALLPPAPRLSAWISAVPRGGRTGAGEEARGPEHGSPLPSLQTEEQDAKTPPGREVLPSLPAPRLLFLPWV